MDAIRPVSFGLLILAAGALFSRLATVAVLAPPSQPEFAYEHGEIARNIVAGRGFSARFLGCEGPTSQQAPFYPLALAGAFWLFGGDTAPSILTFQLAQCVAGTALVLATAWVAWLLVPGRPAVGWLAGAIAAVFPAHLYMVTHIQVAVWAALALTLLMGVSLSLPARVPWTAAILSGTLGGLLLLIDPILALALPPVAWAYFQADRPATQSPRRKIVRRMGRLAVMAAITIVLLAPWIWRNRRVHGEFVFVKSTFGYAFWQGNNPQSLGTDKLPKRSVEAIRTRHDGSLRRANQALWEARHETLYIDDVLLKPSGYREFAGLSEPARSRLLGRRAWNYVCEHPRAYLERCARRLRYFLLFDETNPKAASRIYRATTVGWLAFTAIGLWSWRRRWRVAAAPLAIFALVTAFHTLVITSARFRIPIEPLSLTWTAQGLLTLVDWRWSNIVSIPWRRERTTVIRTDTSTSTANTSPAPTRQRAGAASRRTVARPATPSAKLDATWSHRDSHS